jgi:hypothetical protein
MSWEIIIVDKALIRYRGNINFTAIHVNQNAFIVYMYQTSIKLHLNFIYILNFNMYIWKNSDINISSCSLQQSSIL